MTTAWDFAASYFEPTPEAAHLEDWIAVKLREFAWSQQRVIAESLRLNRYTAVPSCHNAGKSFIAARIVAHWIDTHEPGEAFVVTTAPTAAQVSAILWREVGKAHRKGTLPGNITTAGYPQWKIGAELVGYGRKPAEYSEAAFQGIHARYVLVVMDEAGGISRDLFDAVDALATNENARVLAIGNPDDPTSHFARICDPDSGWNVIRVDGLQTPNMTEGRVAALAQQCDQCRKTGQAPLLQRLFAEEGLAYSTEVVPEHLREMLLSPLWVEERLHRWVGRPGPEQRLSELAQASSLFTAKVRGQFPDSNTEGVIPLGWVEAAVQRWRNWQEAGSPVPSGGRVLGVDVASTGGDQSAVAIRHGQIVREIRKFQQADTMITTGHVAALLDGMTTAYIDSIGIGAGVLDRLREQQFNAIGFVASKNAQGKKDRAGEFKFRNMRAYAWWNLRELLDPSRGAILALPDSEMLKADLTAPRWRVESNATITVEAKDDIRKRLGRSTDEGDAVVMSLVNEIDLGDDTPDLGVLPWDSPVDSTAVVPWFGEDEHL